ncbi:MAG: 3-hydroxyacyl-CoA dehydrogenase [Alphaproteobacteria bacterium]|nr:MAG: 3-hydroxyacyl-CoA dehydrogenase [Alphaproteobacteria bacterium]
MRRTRELPVKTDDLPADFFEKFEKKMWKRIRGQFAPQQAIRAVRAAIELPFEEGVKRERELFLECMANPQSAALRHAFFAEREAARVPDLPVDAKPRPIARVGVVGGGTMGSGIATACLKAGLPVTMIERDAQAAEAGRARVHGFLEHDFTKGRIDEAELNRRKERFSVDTDYRALADADLVIEAVFENMEVKQEVFRRLDAVAKKGAILATNTSYLNVNEIAAATGRPEDVLGLHFFSPAHIMKLLEIVRAEKTAPEVLLTALKFAKTIRKVGVVARVCHGFIGNRMLSGYIRQAGFLILEGATPQQVDRAIYEFGFPMGPFQMGDLAGLDIGYMLRQQIRPDEEEAVAFRVHDRLVEAGAKGQKTGRGFYVYEEGAPKPNPLALEIIEDEAKKAGITRREITDEEIVERCVLPLVNEGARILEEGIAMRAGDIDVVWLYGYGFPRWRGGPMYYGDTLGLDHVLARIRHYAEAIGPRFWTPAPLIERLAAEGRGFRDLDREKAKR